MTARQPAHTVTLDELQKGAAAAAACVRTEAFVRQGFLWDRPPFGGAGHLLQLACDYIAMLNKAVEEASCIDRLETHLAGAAPNRYGLWWGTSAHGVALAMARETAAEIMAAIREDRHAQEAAQWANLPSPPASLTATAADVDIVSGFFDALPALTNELRRDAAGLRCADAGQVAVGLRRHWREGTWRAIRAALGSLPDLPEQPLLVAISCEHFRAVKALASTAPAASLEHTAERENRLERRGGVWEVDFAGNCGRQAPVGLRGWMFLLRLLARPHTPIHALELEGHPAETVPRVQHDAAALDGDAVRQYRARLKQIEVELPEAQGAAERGDPDAVKQVKRLEGERAAIAAELRGMRRGGRGPLLDGGNEARGAVGRVKSALHALKDAMRSKFQMADLAGHLEKYVGQEGLCWAYRPDPPETNWHVHAE